MAEEALSEQLREISKERMNMAAIEYQARLEVEQARQETADVMAICGPAQARVMELEFLLEQSQVLIEDLSRCREKLIEQREQVVKELNEVRQRLQELQSRSD